MSTRRRKRRRRRRRRSSIPFSSTFSFWLKQNVIPRICERNYTSQLVKQTKEERKKERKKEKDM